MFGWFKNKPSAPHGPDVSSIDGHAKPIEPRCSVCGQPPRQFLLLQCDNCGAFSCFGCAKKVVDDLKTILSCGACGSRQVRDILANNWRDFPTLQRLIPWRTAAGEEPRIVFEAEVSGGRWRVRI